jgi:hypothetical protein
VVTPLGWIYPKRLDTREIEAACREGRSTLHGTGIHPGGITERFPLMVSGLSRAITHVRAEEFSDIRTYGAPEVVHEMMLFGKAPAVAKKSPMLKFLGAGFMQSIDMVADTLGFALDAEKRAIHEIADRDGADRVADRADRRRVSSRPKRFAWQGLVRGEPVVDRRRQLVHGRSASRAAAGRRCEPRLELRTRGRALRGRDHGRPEDEADVPRLASRVDRPRGLERNNGIVATAMHCVSAIPYACAAEPGIKTYLDLPLIAGRAAPHLAR